MVYKSEGCCVQIVVSRNLPPTRRNSDDTYLSLSHHLERRGRHLGEMPHKLLKCLAFCLLQERTLRFQVSTDQNNYRRIEKGFSQFHDVAFFQVVMIKIATRTTSTAIPMSKDDTLGSLLFRTRSAWATISMALAWALLDVTIVVLPPDKVAVGEIEMPPGRRIQLRTNKELKIATEPLLAPTRLSAG
ncbi:hypothetical protein M378DRAFT_673945 [Amanita muscaria Koide BX008]|uniref:Uncharacterized protein n=1 Tax=Amanita muscaria (strain Koide BX008) TaxID=946122 RepID=A0A0C2WNV5_AMAMK|nr:hypothetical protein M378DRAFT_673945 [Amanita muscaria Koide BX008]